MIRRNRTHDLTKTANSGGTMRRHRVFQTERVKTEYDIRLDEFFELSEKVDRERDAYHEACELDRRGEYEQADKVLHNANVSPEQIQRRREHIRWRLKQGLAALA